MPQPGQFMPSLPQPMLAVGPSIPQSIPQQMQLMQPAQPWQQEKLVQLMQGQEVPQSMLQQPQRRFLQPWPQGKEELAKVPEGEVLQLQQSVSSLLKKSGDLERQLSDEHARAKQLKDAASTATHQASIA